jgi:putative membrane protein
MRGPSAIARWALRTQTAAVTIEGAEHVPASGPVLLVARHYHHLLDGSVLVDRLPRPVHIVVGLDWAPNRAVRAVMETACRLAGYPIVLRPQTIDGAPAYSRADVLRYTRAALRDTTRLLQAGRVVLLFPEGYPTIDPSGSRKRDDDAFLPFAPGLGAIVDRARRAGVDELKIVPVGFTYARTQDDRWRISARIGAPLGPATPPGEIEHAVRLLSRG